MPRCELNCHFLIQSKYSLVGGINSDLTAESTEGQRELAKLADTFRLTGCNFSRRPNTIRRGRLDLEKVGVGSHLFASTETLQALFKTYFPAALPFYPLEILLFALLGWVFWGFFLKFFASKSKVKQVLCLFRGKTDMSCTQTDQSLWQVFKPVISLSKHNF